ncbi:MAG: hypothetical protein WAX89_03110 [Alphaproteobacteria bacterium]
MPFQPHNQTPFNRGATPAFRPRKSLSSVFLTLLGIVVAISMPFALVYGVGVSGESLSILLFFAMFFALIFSAL